MFRRFALVAIALIFPVAVALTADEKKPDEDGFVTIFDGKSMDGWKVSENPDTIKLVDGAMVCRGERAHAFYVGDEKPFKNFHFIAEVMTKPNSNGGIYFHTKWQESGWPTHGHECQVNNSYHRDPQKTGSVYGVAKVLEAPAKDDVWFKYEIIVEGNKATVKIDDKVVNEYVERDVSPDSPRRISEGTFALQAHDPGSTVLYRNIRVKRLP
jgi:hypothetical protein